MSKDIIMQIVNSHPDLNDFGFGLYSNYENESDEVKAKVKFVNVQDLLDSEDEFCRAIEWIRKNIEPTKGKKKTLSSYGLKHEAEKEIGYLTNGVFIVAMIYCGYPYRIDGPNAIFNVEVKPVFDTGFGSFLTEHIERDNPVGDFARDALNDKSMVRKLSKPHLSIDDIVLYLEANGACSEAIDAAKDAWGMYRSRTDGVYFVRCTHTGLIKIGTSRNVRKRFSQLKVSSSTHLQLIAVIPGGRSLERKIHDKFSSQRVQGEWFDLSESDLSYAISSTNERQLP